ncbi:hypothetical protein TNCV_3505481 [Trichonephila clavipes]|uniref:Uncharacterized protein n=1 Tax=Trichonephila clavipes TaxID=2585209 RepID=A0A8X6S0N4_TRICX|nr:hypothetical protein TNCV_3505481 [Trichonephila clavipes]
MIASTGECAKIWKRVVLYHVLKECHCLPDSVSLQAEKEPAEGRRVSDESEYFVLDNLDFFHVVAAAAPRQEKRML